METHGDRVPTVAPGRAAPSATTRGSATVRERLVAGDHRALGEVYDQFSSFVYGLALRVIGDPRAAEDVSQDVFVWIWERPDAFDPDRGSLRTWLGTLTHRRSVDYVRREEARRRRTERDAALAPSAPDVGEMAAALRHRRARARRARRAARRAAPGHRPRVLRRDDLPRGRRGARHPRGHGEVAAAARAAQDRRRRSKRKEASW